MAVKISYQNSLKKGHDQLIFGYSLTLFSGSIGATNGDAWTP